MKNQQIHLRTSEEDQRALKKAVKNIALKTGKPVDASKAIRAAVNEMAEQAPFWENRPALKNLESNLNYSIGLIQEAVTEFNKLLPDCKPITLEELRGCLGPEPSRKPVVNAIEDLLRSKLMNGKKTAKVDGITLDREKVAEMMVLPHYDNFLEVLEKYNKMIPTATFSRENFDEIFWECFELKAGQVSFNYAEIEKFKDGFRQRAVNETEKARLRKVIEVCECLNNLIKNEPGLKPEKLQSLNVILFDSDKGLFVPSEMFVKYGKN